MTFKNFFSSLLLIALSGCGTLPRLAAVNLGEPGWARWEGQAVWRAKRAAPEIAGEILVATHSDGRTFVQFTKTPFPLVVAQSTTNAWQIESPGQNKRYSGRGQPPQRLIWFQLAAALLGAEGGVQAASSNAGLKAPGNRGGVSEVGPRSGVNAALRDSKDWSWQQMEDQRWRLENLSTGEALEGYFKR
jgi:hypothetical protein